MPLLQNIRDRLGLSQSTAEVKNVQNSGEFLRLQKKFSMREGDLKGGFKESGDLTIGDLVDLLSIFTKLTPGARYSDVIPGTISLARGFATIDEFIEVRKMEHAKSIDDLDRSNSVYNHTLDFGKIISIGNGFDLYHGVEGVNIRKSPEAPGYCQVELAYRSQSGKTNNRLIDVLQKTGLVVRH